MTTTLTKPVPLVVLAEHIPSELMGRPQWVNWLYVLKKDKLDKWKWTKPPYISTATVAAKASSTDPATWSSFDQALAALPRFDGIGFVLTAADDYAALDLDHCRDPEVGTIDEWARALIAAVPSYWEVSPSGTGLRCLFRGRLPDTGKHKGLIELYDRGRYVTLTGHPLPGTPRSIEPQQAALDTLLAQVFAAGPPHEDNGHAARGRDDVDDETLLRRARSASNGAKFTALWAGDLNGYPSASEADLALCVMLAFWTGRDAARIDRLFRQSGLVREKWTERHGAQTYGALTIAKAVVKCGDVYQARPRGTPPPADSSAPGWPLYDGADDWDFPAIEELVQDLLPLTGIVWWGGLPKRYKSLLALYLSLAIACRRSAVAKHFLIRAFPKILYVGREDGGPRFKARRADILSAWTERPERGAITFVIRPHLDLLNPEHVAWLRETCRRKGITMLVLDTWTALSPSADPLGPKDQAQLAAVVVQLAEDIDGMVMVVDHSRKNRPDGQPLSSAEIFGPPQKWAAAEHIVMLDVTADGRRLEVFIEGKDLETRRFLLTVSPKGSGEEKFAYAGTIDELADAQRAVGDQNRAAILRLVQATETPLTPAQVTTRLRPTGIDLKEGTVKKHLQALFETHQVRATGKTRDRRYFALDFSSIEPSCSKESVQV